MSHRSQLPTERFGIHVSDRSLAMPEYMVKSEGANQVELDRAAAARLLLY